MKNNNKSAKPRVCRRGWYLEDYQNEARQYPSRLKLRLTDPSLYTAFKRFPGELDKIFAPRVIAVRDTDEASVRREASKYSSRKDFAAYDIDMYKAALRLEIMDDLGFTSSTGFDNTKPAQLYVGNVLLNDGTQGTMLGITTKHIYGRFWPEDVSRISNAISFKFAVGSHASKLEKHLKKTFFAFAVKPGLSPLRDKVGTSGEVLVGVSVQDVVKEIRLHNHDISEPVGWPEHPFIPTTQGLARS